MHMLQFIAELVCVQSHRNLVISRVPMQAAQLSNGSNSAEQIEQRMTMHFLGRFW